MQQPGNWFEFKFSFGHLSLETYPRTLERLRGTPSRLADRLGLLPREVLTQRDGEAWSIQEHAGHLIDLGGLDWARVDDYAAGRETLTAADVQNRKTYASEHNKNTIENILATLREERLMLVGKLEAQGEAFTERSAFHPRLKMQMRVMDWAYFVAEHDDHHLAQISELIRKFASDGGGNPHQY